MTFEVDVWIMQFYLQNAPTACHQACASSDTSRQVAYQPQCVAKGTCLVLCKILLLLNWCCLPRVWFLTRLWNMIHAEVWARQTALSCPSNTEASARKLSQWFLPTNSSKCIPRVKVFPVESLLSISCQRNLCSLWSRPPVLPRITRVTDSRGRSSTEWGGMLGPLVLSHVWCQHMWLINTFKPAKAGKPN